MGADRVDGGDEIAEIQAESGALEPPAAWETPYTLADDLIDVVDDIRAIPAELGLRPYRVFLVHARWTGGEEGEGQLVVIAEREIQPPPLVQDVSTLSQVLRATGLTEEGDVKVSEISARFTEDDLVGLTPDLLDPAHPGRLLSGVEFFYEMREARAAAAPTVRRRFVPTGTPSLSKEGLQWIVTLSKQDGGRGRDGSTDRSLR